MLNFAMHCHLLLPDLLWTEHDLPGIHQNLSVPALERLLAKGRQRALDSTIDSVAAWLCARYGVERQPDWPSAPYALLAEGLIPGDHAWLHADPVHLELEGHRMMLAGSETLELTRAEADALIASLNAAFAADGLYFVAPSPARWYLRLPQDPEVETVALAQARGRSIEHLLPRGKGAALWRARANALQMLMHEHEVNAKRTAAGKLSANSVWLWGGGRAQALPSAPHAGMWSHNALAAGLALSARTRTHPLPAHASEFLSASSAQGVELIVLEHLSTPAHFGDAGAWSEALQRLEQEWIAPLLEALRRERIGMLSLDALGPAGAVSIELTRGDLRRFWKRVRPLAAFCGSMR